MVQGTVLSWVAHLTEDRVFIQERDAPRFRKAFARLGTTMKKWPAPSDFLAALPPFREPREAPRLESDSGKERAKAEISKLEAMLRTATPAQSKKPPPIVVDDFPRCCVNGTREQPVCDDCKAEFLAVHGPVNKFKKEASNGQI